MLKEEVYKLFALQANLLFLCSLKQAASYKESYGEVSTLSARQRCQPKCKWLTHV